jgi:hypothetical protein
MSSLANDGVIAPPEEQPPIQDAGSTQSIAPDTSSTPEAAAQANVMVDPTSIPKSTPEQDGGTPGIAESLNVRNTVVPSTSATSMSPASFQRGGNCMLKIGGKSHKTRGAKSHKKHGRKTHKKHGKKTQKKRGRKSQQKRNRK